MDDKRTGQGQTAGPRLPGPQQWPLLLFHLLAGLLTLLATLNTFLGSSLNRIMAFLIAGSIVTAVWAWALLPPARRLSWRLGLFCTAFFLLWVEASWVHSGNRGLPESTTLSFVAVIVLCWASLVVGFGSNLLWARRFLWFLVAVCALNAGYSLLGPLVGWTDLPGISQARSDDRIAGLFTNPNQFAGLFVLSLPLAIGAFVDGFGKNICWRILAALFTLVLLAGLWKTHSRGALVGFLLGGLLLAALAAWRRRRRWLGAGLGLLVAGIVALGALYSIILFNFYFTSNISEIAVKELKEVVAGKTPSDKDWAYYDFNRDHLLDERDLKLAETLEQERLGGIRQEQLSSGAENQSTGQGILSFFRLDQQNQRFNAIRLLIFASCFQMWKEHPNFGIGPGNFGHLYPNYMLVKLEDSIWHAHCLPLHLAVELGWPGLLAFLALLAWMARRAWRQSRSWAPTGFYLWWALAGVLIHNLTDVTIWYHPQKYFLPFLFALAFYASRAPEGEAAAGASPTPRATDTPEGTA